MRALFCLSASAALLLLAHAKNVPLERKGDTGAKEEFLESRMSDASDEAAAALSYKSTQPRPVYVPQKESIRLQSNYGNAPRDAFFGWEDDKFNDKGKGSGSNENNYKGKGETSIEAPDVPECKGDYCPPQGYALHELVGPGSHVYGGEVQPYYGPNYPFYGLNYDKIKYVAGSGSGSGDDYSYPTYPKGTYPPPFGWPFYTSSYPAEIPSYPNYPVGHPPYYSSSYSSYSPYARSDFSQDDSEPEGHPLSQFSRRSNQNELVNREYLRQELGRNPIYQEYEKPPSYKPYKPKKPEIKIKPTIILKGKKGSKGKKGETGEVGETGERGKKGDVAPIIDTTAGFISLLGTSVISGFFTLLASLGVAIPALAMAPIGFGTGPQAPQGIYDVNVRYPGPEFANQGYGGKYIDHSGKFGKYNDKTYNAWRRRSGNQ